MGKNVVAFALLYIYVQFIVCPLHTVLALLTGYCNPFRVVKAACDIMGVRFKHTKGSSKLHPSAMYLCNHRSWGDFFVDQAVCNGGAYLSRYLVIVGVPMSSLYAWVAHSTWFFNRKAGIDRDELARLLAGLWASRPSQGLVVYPEGTRNQKSEPLKIKTGVLKMAYDFNKPVQCVITSNKELIANERNFHVERNVTCITSVSPVIEPSKFKTFDDFIEVVRKSFQDTWADAYDSNASLGAVPYEVPLGLPAPSFKPLPIPQRAWIVRLILLSLALGWYFSRQAASKTA